MSSTQTRTSYKKMAASPTTRSMLPGCPTTQTKKRPANPNHTISDDLTDEREVKRKRLCAVEGRVTGPAFTERLPLDRGQLSLVKDRHLLPLGYAPASTPSHESIIHISCHGLQKQALRSVMFPNPAIDTKSSTNTMSSQDRTTDDLAPQRLSYFAVNAYFAKLEALSNTPWVKTAMVYQDSQLSPSVVSYSPSRGNDVSAAMRPTLESIPKGSVSSVSSSGRAGSYSSNLDVLNRSIAIMESCYGRVSPGGSLSPGGISPPARPSKHATKLELFSKRATSDDLYHTILGNHTDERRVNKQGLNIGEGSVHGRLFSLRSRVSSLHGQTLS